MENTSYWMRMNYEPLGNFEGGYVKKALYGLKEIIQKERHQ